MSSNDDRSSSSSSSEDTPKNRLGEKNIGNELENVTQEIVGISKDSLKHTLEGEDGKGLPNHTVNEDDEEGLPNQLKSSEVTGDGTVILQNEEALPKKLIEGQSGDSENSLKHTVDGDEKRLSNELKSIQVTNSGDNDQENLNMEIKGLSNLVTEKEENLDADNALAEEEKSDPVFDGIEAPELEMRRNSSDHSLDQDSSEQASAWPLKAALTNFVKERGTVAVSTVMRRLSGEKDDENSLVEVQKNETTKEDEKNVDSMKESKEQAVTATDSKLKDALTRAGERFGWNGLNLIKMGPKIDVENNPKKQQMDDKVDEPRMKGRVIVYTRIGCQECKEVRLFMQQKQLKFVEINIDIYPSRKLELEKNSGTSAVPKVYLNDSLVGGLSELKDMDQSGKLDEKIKDLINQEPPSGSPLPPLPGEDDESGSGKLDEFASVVRKMKESLLPKDRFYRMRKFNNCFLGSEAVNLLAEDQYLERPEAVEFGRKLANNHFFRHVSDENIFEDGNHLYRFLEHDPLVMSQCYNIPRGILDVKPKPATEIASRLRFLSFALFEAYVSEDGRHVDYGNIKNSEEYKRYLRTVEELQRVDMDGLSREEKLAFFINLYNMISIHAILTTGFPAGPLERRKFFGDIKYVIGGSTYSLSAIQNGVLRANQRPPYNLMKPFGPRDRRSKVALPYPEPLIHFALVCGARSSPALRCYSPGNIDKELVDAASDFMRSGELVVDIEAKVIYANKILQWYSVDFGKNEVDVMKHAANYLDPPKSEELLELLASTQLKVVYQPYDWSMNC